jgi:hypothetical protein
MPLPALRPGVADAGYAMERFMPSAAARRSIIFNSSRLNRAMRSSNSQAPTSQRRLFSTEAEPPEQFMRG